MKTLLKDPITADSTTLLEVLREHRYITGNPRQYRANAKEGNFNLEGTENLGNSARLHVLGYRIFESELFKNQNLWLELFFLDEEKNVSSILFNSYSVKNFEGFQSRLFYRNVPLEQVVIEVTWARKTTEGPDNKTITYHVANFKVVQQIEEDITGVVNDFVSEVLLYREDTAPSLVDNTRYYKSIEAHNYAEVAQKAIPAPADEAETVEADLVEEELPI